MLIKVFACGEKPICSPLSVRTNATALNPREKRWVDHVRTWHSSTGVGYRSACSQLFNCRSQAGDPSADARQGSSLVTADEPWITRMLQGVRIGERP
jgi:hypothetical protein